MKILFIRSKVKKLLNLLKKKIMVNEIVYRWFYTTKYIQNFFKYTFKSIISEKNLQIKIQIFAYINSS